MDKLAIGEYSSGLFNIQPKVTAVISIMVVTAIHLFGVKTGGRAQNIFTGFKLSLIIFFCLVPFFLNHPAAQTRFIPEWSDLSVILSPGWAVSLVFVVYAYSGWNASSYIAGSLENPAKNLPLSLISGTVVVLIIYLALNGMFLYFSELSELNGKSDIGNVVAFKFFGEKAGTVFSGIFSFALLSTLSAMTIAGPRVGQAMGEDYKMLAFLRSENRFGMPWISVVFQSGWAIFLVLTSSFKEIIQYVSVSLSWFTLFTVLGVFILRKKQSDQTNGFRIPFFPWPPLIFAAVTIWMIFYLTISNPSVIYYSLGTIFAGGAAYIFVSRKTIP
jgi:APA family basic amino acid/polyamine antiporter